MEEQPRDVEPRLEIADLALHGRIVGHRDVLGLDHPLLHVVGRELEGRLRDAHVDGGVAQGESLHHSHARGRAWLAQGGVLRNANAGQGDGRAEGRAHAQGVPLAVRGDAGALRGYHGEEEGVRHVAAAVEGAPDHVVGSAEGHGAEVLDPVDYPAVVRGADHRLHGEGAREADRGLTAPAAEHLAALDHLGIVPALLRVRGEGVDEAHDRRVHVQRHGGARAPPGDDPDDGDVGRHVEPHAAVGGGDRAGEEALALEVRQLSTGFLPSRSYAGRARGDLLARQRVGAIDEVLAHAGAAAA